MYNVSNFEKRKHSFVVDADTQEEVCIGCGKKRDEHKRGPHNKFSNEVTTYGEFPYASKLEADYAEQLDWRMKAKDIKSWRRQVPIELRHNEILIATYRMDFEITHNDGTVEWVECKGMELPMYRMKKKLLEAIYAKELRDRSLIFTVVKRQPIPWRASRKRKKGI